MAYEWALLGCTVHSKGDTVGITIAGSPALERQTELPRVEDRQLPLFSFGLKTFKRTHRAAPRPTTTTHHRYLPPEY